MLVWRIFCITVLRNVRDRGSFTEMLLLPVILIFILGNALSGMFSPGQIQGIDVALVGHQDGTDTELVYEFLRNDEIQGMLTLRESTDAAQARQWLAEGQVSAIIHAEQFQQVYQNGDPVAILVETRSQGSYYGEIVTAIMESFIQGANTVQAQWTLGEFATGYEYHGPYLDVQSLPSGETASAMDYYAVTMLVMIVLYGAMYAAHGMGEDFLSPVGRRLRSAPVPPLALFTGKVLGVVFTIGWQIGVLMIITTVGFGVNWGTQPWAIVGICFSMAVFSTALGVLSTAVFRDVRIANNVLNVLIPVSTFLAGGYMRFDYPGELFGFLQHLSPSYLVQTSLFNTIYGGGAGQTMQYLLVLWVLTALMFASGVFFIRRETGQ